MSRNFSEGDLVRVHHASYLIGGIQGARGAVDLAAWVYQVGIVIQVRNTVWGQTLVMSYPGREVEASSIHFERVDHA